MKNAKGIYTDKEYIEMKDDIEVQLLPKQAALSDEVGEVLDIETIINFVTYYLSHLDEIFLKVSPEGKLIIAGSIMPLGVVYERKNFRTVPLAPQFD